jgi:hypothetical protein
MDTNSLAQNAAIIATDRGPLHAARIGLAAAALFASAGLVAAQASYPVGAGQYCGLYEGARGALPRRRSIIVCSIAPERAAAKVLAAARFILKALAMSGPGAPSRPRCERSHSPGRFQMFPIRSARD